MDGIDPTPNETIDLFQTKIVINMNLSTGHIDPGVTPLDYFLWDYI